jgi:hypothetical protein
MMKLSACTIAVIAAATTSNAFVANTPRAIGSRTQEQQQSCTALFVSGSDTTESAFVADVAVGEEEEDDKTFDAVEMMGKGAAKVRSRMSRWCT